MDVDTLTGTEWIANLRQLEDWALQQRLEGLDVFAFAWEDREEFRRLARIYMKEATTADLLGNMSVEGRSSTIIINNLQITHLW